MNIRKVLVGAAIVLVAVTGIIIAARAAHGQAAEQASPDVSGKLDQVLSNQKSIMQSLESMKQELNIIKIRITQRQ